jgi:3-oxoacyl-[acyl-carrier protein] reductase|tara:strand:- start:416 stop:1096 length:681 start_codon:yes stop_codon:yes gene_type:complete
MSFMKNVIITGASRGIGFELTNLFSEKGYKVIALSRNISRLNIPNVTAYQLDISCEKSILKTVKLILNDFSQVDILINNAGTLINKPFSQTSFNDFESIYKVNVFGLAELIRLLLSCFNENSHVVNISSIGGIGGSSKFPGLSAYSSSKGALNILTEMLSEEFKDSGPSFNCLALGAVQTEMLEEAFPGFQAKVSPLEMANYIYNFSIEGNKLFNGKTIPISTSNP